MADKMESMSNALAYIDFKKGETYLAHIGHLGEARKVHIVEVIQEGLTFCPMIVYRYYSKTRRRWQYMIDTAYLLTADIDTAKYSTP